MQWSFAFDRAARLLLAPLGIWPGSTWVQTTADELEVHFGAWRLTTPLANIKTATVTGPYAWPKAIGPHLSMADRGVTFGTNARAGACVCFVNPVPALLPWGLVRHPAATLTVTDPRSLADHLEASLHRRRG